MRVVMLLAIAALGLLFAVPAIAAEAGELEPSPLLKGWSGVCPPCSASAGLESASSPGTLMPTGGSAFGGIGSYGIAGSALHFSQPEEPCPPAPSCCKCSCCGCCP
ncbi:MAG TPA: hypothetical protein DFS52_32325 [Myxococcales bacterium]|jgi:hypothetical protein|nr:hypothetical protein [Myxococcales bacterium]